MAFDFVTHTNFRVTENGFSVPRTPSIGGLVTLTWQVSWLTGLGVHPAFPVSQWPLSGECSPFTVAGQPRIDRITKKLVNQHPVPYCFPGRGTMLREV